MVRTLCFHCQRHGFNPWLASWDPTRHMVWPKKRNLRDFQYKDNGVNTFLLSLPFLSHPKNSRRIRNRNTNSISDETRRDLYMKTETSGMVMCLGVKPKCPKRDIQVHSHSHILQSQRRRKGFRLQLLQEQSK